MTEHPGDVIAQQPTVLEAALALAETDDHDRYGPEGSVEPWYPGELVDHIYAHCPALRRSLNGGQPRQGRGPLYPDAGDVCGWCRRVWHARKETTR
jgi:hypothetical protein